MKKLVDTLNIRTKISIILLLCLFSFDIYMVAYNNPAPWSGSFTYEMSEGSIVAYILSYTIVIINLLLISDSVYYMKKNGRLNLFLMSDKYYVIKKAFINSFISFLAFLGILTYNYIICLIVFHGNNYDFSILEAYNITLLDAKIRMIISIIYYCVYFASISIFCTAFCLIAIEKVDLYIGSAILFSIITFYLKIKPVSAASDQYANFQYSNILLFIILSTVFLFITNYLYLKRDL